MLDDVVLLNDLIYKLTRRRPRVNGSSKSRIEQIQSLGPV